MSQTMFIDLAPMDWKLLRAQKRALIEISESTLTEFQASTIEGMLNLLDHIQDQAVDLDLATHDEVFGVRDKDGNYEIEDDMQDL